MTLVFMAYGCEKDDKVTTIADIEGNVYKTVTIGNQTWMAENLKTTKYLDNTLIPVVTDTTAWSGLITAACSWYRNDAANKAQYGVMYNWFAVQTGKLCPAGWHVPSDSDYNDLELYLGIKPSEVNVWGWRGTSQGAQLKGSAGWPDPVNSNTNTSGFSALPGGYRQGAHGTFNGLGLIAIFWTSTDDSFNNKPLVAWYRRLDGLENKVHKATTAKTGGHYIRCIKK